MTLLQALELIGGLSKPSKMPCFGWSIPAKYCKVGERLSQIKNTICSKCYAKKGYYPCPTVKNALEKRYLSLSNPDWVNAMTLAISGSEGSGYFRWHDSGDIQSLAHLEMIVQVCKNLPSIKFWLPTREYMGLDGNKSIIHSYLEKHGSFPDNLTVRLSATKIDGPPPSSVAKRLNLVTSGVSKVGFTCPSSQQNGKCLACRACWNKEVENVNYKLH